MRKSVFMLAALFAIAAACTKEVAETPYYGEDVNPNAPVFKAGISTKATLEVVNSTTAKVNWASGDALTIWNGTQAAEYSTTDTGTSATFTTGDEFDAAASYVAIYPADGSAAFSAGSVTTTLPATQTAVAGTFDPAASIAVATSTSTSLSFNNLVTYVQFTVPAGMDDLTSVSFKGNAGEKVAGEVTINTATPALTATGSTTATLSGTFTEGETYYLAVAPGNYASGYTLVITRDSGSYDMNSLKNVTFERSSSRNIGNLWNGVVVMEGSAIGSSYEMSALPFPGNVNNSDLVYDYRGPLSAGKLSIRGMAAVATDVTIPADGNYHVMYNKTQGKVRIYSQELFSHFGKSTPMNNGTGTSYYPVDFTLNDCTGVGNGSEYSLKDYYGNTTEVSVLVNSSGATGTWKNDNENVFGSSGNRATNSPYVDGDYFPSYGWGRPASFTNSDKTVDSGDIFFTFSGLDNSAVYDVKVVGIRYSSSLNLRVSRYTIGSDERIVDTGLPAASKLNLNEFKARLAAFNGISPSAGSIVLKVNALSRYRESNKDYFCEAYVDFIYISKVIYSKN